jgi:hypothetical protein
MQEHILVSVCVLLLVVTLQAQSDLVAVMLMHLDSEAVQSLHVYAGLEMELMAVSALKADEAAVVLAALMVTVADTAVLEH